MCLIICAPPRETEVKHPIGREPARGAGAVGISLRPGQAAPRTLVQPWASVAPGVRAGSRDEYAALALGGQRHRKAFFLPPVAKAGGSVFVDGGWRDDMRATGLVVAAAIAALSGAAEAMPCRDVGDIRWKVEGRFRLTDTNADARRATDALLDRIARARGPDGNPSMSAAYDEVIGALVSKPGGDGLYRQTFYDRTAERYRHRLADGRSLLESAAHDIRLTPPAGPGDCVWATGAETKTAPCGAAVTLSVPVQPDGSTTAVTLTTGAGDRLQVCIQVRDTLIVAFGDSFAAGESNPDRPTDWSALPTPGYRPRGRSSLEWWSRRPGLPASASADWWDNTCHRSLLSQHAQAALAMAASDPHGTVTFVSFACSGATVLDGFVAPRSSSPAGYRSAAPGGSTAHRVSQINQAVELLCADEGPARYEILPIPGEARHWNRLIRKTVREAGQRRTEIAVRQCDQWRRRPDVILNSLGGNDIGFAGVGTWAVVPPAGRGLSFMPVVNGVPALTATNGLGLICPMPIPGQRRCRAPYAEDLVKDDLPLMLGLANRALDASGLASTGTVKVQTPYPSILRDANGALCGGEWTVDDEAPRDDEGLARGTEPWLAQFLRIPFANPRGWSFGIANEPTYTECSEEGAPAKIQLKEACVIETRIWRPLNETVRREMSQAGWRVVDAEPTTLTHGVCAYSPPAGDLAAYNREFGWPRWEGDRWSPDYPTPQAWDAYRRRDGGRWFRTANDSALTQFVATRNAKGREEAVSGTIHPSAQAHARLADLIVASASAAQ